MNECTLLVAVILFSHHATISHSLHIGANKSWPYISPTNIFAPPMIQNRALPQGLPTQKNDPWNIFAPPMIQKQALPQGLLTQQNDPWDSWGGGAECGVDNNPLPPTPTKTIGGAKEVIIDQLLKIGTTQTQSENVFPISYVNGIVISAGAPPTPGKDKYKEYQETNMAQWSLTANPEAQLEAELRNDPRIIKVMKIDGVYEGCAEKSFVVDLNTTFDKFKVGEEYRYQYGQDSYLWYSEATRNNMDCLDTANPYGRSFGLGFGPTFPGEQFPGLGTLCTYPAPIRDLLPEACSVSGNTMWANENSPWPKYNNELMVAKGCA